jgi:hypothetical protein
VFWEAFPEGGVRRKDESRIRGVSRDLRPPPEERQEFVAVIEPAIEDDYRA